MLTCFDTFDATSVRRGAGANMSIAIAGSAVSHSSTRVASTTTGIRSWTFATTEFGRVVKTENLGWAPATLAGCIRPPSSTRSSVGAWNQPARLLVATRKIRLLRPRSAL